MYPRKLQDRKSITSKPELMSEYFKLPEENKISETESYETFSKEIDYLVNFFDCFSDLLFSNGMTKSFISDKGVYLFDTRLKDIKLSLPCQPYYLH